MDSKVLYARAVGEAKGRRESSCCAREGYYGGGCYWNYGLKEYVDGEELIIRARTSRREVCSRVMSMLQMNWIQR